MLNQTGTTCSDISAANVRRRHFDDEEMRRWPREATMHIALTLPFGPAIVFQLIAATLRRTTLTDGKVFVWVHEGARQIVLTGGEKWILGPNDARPRAEPLRQISKCWSIQSAGNQEIRWRCLYRSGGYYTTMSRESFAWWSIIVSQLVFWTFTAAHSHLSASHNVTSRAHFLIYKACSCWHQNDHSYCYCNYSKQVRFPLSAVLLPTSTASQFCLLCLLPLCLRFKK